MNEQTDKTAVDSDSGTDAEADVALETAPAELMSDPLHAPEHDARRNAVRPDLADKRLQGKVQASTFVDGQDAIIARSSVPVRRQPHASAPVDTEALFGERVSVFESNSGWAWVQLDRDRYVGYLPVDTLGAPAGTPTHQVRAIGTFVYPEPDIKAPPSTHLSLNSKLTVVESEKDFHLLESGGYVTKRHVAPISKFARDYVAVAERFIGTPYLWGGRTRIGIDCSGLVQVALQAAGVDAPRDSDMQLHELGATVLIPDDLEGLERGDLVFWDGHVGIMSDGIMLLHANAHSMAVTYDTLPEAVERIAKLGQGSKIKAIKRFEP